VFDESVAAPLARAPLTRGFPRSRPLRCPDCGRLIYADPELAGTCPICPGLVPLARA